VASRYFMGSNGKVHPSGGSWRRKDGGPKTIATITVAQRDALYELASSFDEMPELKPHISLPGEPRYPATTSPSTSSTK
jgi:hypothetical protein